MKEKPTSNSAEDNSLDEAAEKKNKKTTKISKVARRMPLGVQVDAEKTGETKPEKPRLSISERLMQQMETKAAKTEATDDKEKKTENLVEEPQELDSKLAVESPLTETTEEFKPAGELEVPEKNNDTEIIPEPAPSPEDESPAALETADWNNEGEFGDGGEIQLNPAPTETPSDQPEDEPAEDFPEITPTLAYEQEPSNEPVEPELLEEGLEAEGPPEPPEDLPEDASGSEDGPDYSHAVSAAERPWYDAAAADRERRNREQELGDAEYRAEKRGVRKGLGAGLLAGWLFGRHGKKKAEKAHVKELKSKNTEIKSLKTEQAIAKERLSAIENTREQLRASVLQEVASTTNTPAKNEVQRPVEVAVTAENLVPKANIEPIAVKVAEKLSTVIPEVTLTPAESFSLPIETVSSNETVIKKPEQLPKTEKLPKEQEINEDTYQPDDGTRVETSAWHRIEIDEKTGKPVENPNVEYGEEFKQEILREDRKGGTASAPAAGAIGGLATSSAAVAASSEPSVYENASETGLEVPRLQQPPEHAHLSAGNEVLRHASNPRTWVVAAIIVIVLFTIGALR